MIDLTDTEIDWDRYSVQSVPTGMGGFQVGLERDDAGAFIRRNDALAERRLVRKLLAEGMPPLPEGKALVDFDALRDILKALVNEPHRIRELQATQQPPELFPNNPINVLIQDFYAACRVRQGVTEG